MGEDEVCKAHSGIKESITELKDKISKLDNRLWGLVVASLFQLIGIIAILLKGA
jgi:hypothetical protein